MLYEKLMLKCIENPSKVSLSEFGLRINTIVKDTDSNDLKKKIEFMNNLEEESKRFIPTLLKKNLEFKKSSCGSNVNNLTTSISKGTIKEKSDKISLSNSQKKKLFDNNKPATNNEPESAQKIIGDKKHVNFSSRGRSSSLFNYNQADNNDKEQKENYHTNSNNTSTENNINFNIKKSNLNNMNNINALKSSGSGFIATKEIISRIIEEDVINAEKAEAIVKSKPLIKGKLFFNSLQT